MGEPQGIDVSNVQGARFPWAGERGRISFGMAKATEGLTFTDPDFQGNWDAMWQLQHAMRPAADQMPHHCGANETCAACDENIHAYRDSRGGLRMIMVSPRSTWSTRWPKPTRAALMFHAFTTNPQQVYF